MSALNSSGDKLTIAFGRRTFPADLEAVWGARLIWPNDFLGDRQDIDARTEDARRELITWLDGNPSGTGAIQKMREAMQSPYNVGLNPSMTTNDEVVIYEDDKGKIVGSTQNSGGYVYVAGWLHKHTA